MEQITSNMNNNLTLPFQYVSNPCHRVHRVQTHARLTRTQYHFQHASASPPCVVVAGGSRARRAVINTGDATVMRARDRTHQAIRIGSVRFDHICISLSCSTARGHTNTQTRERARGMCVQKVECVRVHAEHMHVTPDRHRNRPICCQPLTNHIISPT